MTEQKSPELPALTAPYPVKGADQKSRLAIGLAALALAGVLLLSWLVCQGSERIEATRQELSRRLADGDAAQREAQANAKQNREALDALQAKLGALEARAAEMQGQQLAIDTMYRELSRVKDDRLLTEIEQEISLAAQQLQLAGNVEVALIALQSAELRLAKSAQPQFLSLRKLLNRDIERLKSLPGADVPGIAFKLDAQLNVLPSLPLAFEQRPAPAVQEKGFPAATQNFDWQALAQTWLADVWREVRQLVRIERIDRPDPGLLAPHETFFLRENLRLRLLTARLALLARDGRTFQSDLKQARQWLENYFDTRAASVQEALAALKGLERLDVMGEPVELNETLAALRNFKMARERTTR